MPRWKAAIITEACGPKSYFVKTDCGRIWKRHADQIRINKSESKQTVLIIPRSELNQGTLEDKEVTEDNNEPVPGNAISGVSLRRRSQLKPPNRLVVG